MRSSTTSVHKSQSYSRSYSPSVPLSVYRELAAELQAAKALLHTLNVDNQHLAKQNQQLRQEIEKVMQCALLAHQVAATTRVDQADVYHSVQNFSKQRSHPVSRHRSQPTRNSSTLTQVEGVEVDSYRRRFQPENVSEVSGWGLAIAILLVVVTTFGAGYLLVRPLISSR